MWAGFASCALSTYNDIVDAKHPRRFNALIYRELDGAQRRGNTMSNIQAIRVHAHGGPDKMKLESIGLEAPAEGMLRVRHTAIGVNYIDTYHRSGLYHVDLPHGIGGEACGIVEAVGSGVDETLVGQRVAYVLGQPGSYATHRNVAADRVVRVPDGLDDKVVAASMLKGMTAWYLLKRVWPFQKGNDILVHAAAGGMGLFLTRWGTHLGFRIIGTAGSKQKAQLARDAGATDVILYREESFPERVRALTDGKGVAGVLDGVGHDTFMGSLESLRTRGILVTFGNASGQPPEFAPGQLAPMGSLYVTRPSLFHYIQERQELETAAADVFKVLQDGIIDGAPHLEMPLADAAEVHRRLEARETTGACVLVP